MRRKRYVILVLVLCLLFVGVYSFFVEDEENSQFYLKTVVYKDKDNMLVPVSINFYNELDIEEEVLNRIDMMKSNELSSQGLYPLFSEELKVNHVDLTDSVLTIDFNDQLYANGDGLDIIEALSFTLCDYEEVESLHLQINGEDITNIPNSDISVSYIQSSIGLNNFDETDTLLHHTYPVMIYHIKTINNRDYFVPITTRINEKDTIYHQVSTILNLIDSEIECIDASLNDGTLKITLDSSILLEDGTIDKNLFDQLSLSFSSIESVDEVDLIVDNETLVNETVSSIQINYIKI
ncbi:MAG: GerMN domain-containing protein [Bacilli bacterium]|nr:GerMN domain-containing protein [Bacilli bacterium]